MFARMVLVVVVVVASFEQAGAADWIFDYGKYTADPKTGLRVDQYQKPKPANRVPYYKFFSPDGPHPYIPYAFYEDELGFPGSYSSMPYGIGGNDQGIGAGGVGYPGPALF